MLTFEELILTQGTDAARNEKQARKLAILGEARLDLKSFEILIGRIKSLDIEFKEACEKILSSEITERPYPESAQLLEQETQAEWVIRQLREAEGEIFGPDIYDRWQASGGNRRAIQTTVSQLISDKQIKKGKWESRGKQRGSWVHFKLKN